MSSIYDYKANSLDGKEVPLSDFQGKVVLIVNTASRCGFTPQYAGLEEVYKAYQDKGLTILGFPCNQFGAQEPGTTPTAAARRTWSSPSISPCETFVRWQNNALARARHRFLPR